MTVKQLRHPKAYVVDSTGDAQRKVVRRRVSAVRTNAVLYGIGGNVNHKRGRPKRRRAGCLMCKPHKAGLTNDEKTLSKTGFGKLRKIVASKQDLKDDV